ncbi:O-antigen ligase family protein [Motilimonas eburnea]|nr:O-antigen ligase family protein [Motilimonas eburnea]
MLFFCVFFVFSLFVFRIREYGSSDVDFQIVFRLVAWFGGSTIAALYFYKFGFKVVSNHELLLISFLLLALIMLPFSMLPFRSFVVLLSYTSFYLYIKYVKSRFGDEYLLYSVSVAFFLVICSSYFYYVALPDLGRHIYWLNDVLYVSPRMSGVFSTSNAMGGFCAVYGIFLIYSYKQGVLKKNFFVVAFVLCLIALLLSNSKTALASFLISSLFLFKRNKLISFLLLLGSFTFLTILVYAIYDFTGFLTSISRHGDPEEVLTFTGRTYIWPAVWDMALERPLSGYGIGVTSLAIPTLADSIGYTPAHAHNLALQAFFSLGLGGLICIIAILIYNLVCRTRNRLSNAMAVYIFITSLFEASFLSGIAGYSIIPLIFMVLCKNDEK